MSRNKRKIGSFSMSPETAEGQEKLRIFNILKSSNAASVPDISKNTGINENTAAEYINACVKKDLLRISGAEKEGGVDFAEGDSAFLGIGFSNQECVISVLDLSGKVINKENIGIAPLVKMKGRVKEIKEIVERVRGGTQLSGKAFTRVGIAVPERLRELVGKSPDILAEGAAHIFNCDVLIGKAATAAGYAERESAAAAAGRDALYVHSDVGAGVVVKGDMIFEADKEEAAKEFSYLRPWNQFSIVTTAKNLVNKGLGTDIVNMVGGDIESITLDVVLRAAEDRDELAEDLVKRAGLALGVRTAYLVNMFRPEIVILGGGTEKKEGDFLQFVKESADKFYLNELADKVEMIPGVLGEEASSVGAALLCRREVFMEV